MMFYILVIVVIDHDIKGIMFYENEYSLTKRSTYCLIFKV